MRSDMDEKTKDLFLRGQAMVEEAKLRGIPKSGVEKVEAIGTYLIVSIGDNKDDTSRLGEIFFSSLSAALIEGASMLFGWALLALGWGAFAVAVLATVIFVALVTR